MSVHAIAFAAIFSFEPESRAKPGNTLIELVDVTFGSDLKTVKAAANLAPVNKASAVKAVNNAKAVNRAQASKAAPVRPDKQEPTETDRQRVAKVNPPQAVDAATETAKAPTPEKVVPSPAVEAVKPDRIPDNVQKVAAATSPAAEVTTNQVKAAQVATTQVDAARVDASQVDAIKATSPDTVAPVISPTSKVPDVRLGATKAERQSSTMTIASLQKVQPDVRPAKKRVQEIVVPRKDTKASAPITRLQNKAVKVDAQPQGVQRPKAVQKAAVNQTAPVTTKPSTSQRPTSQQPAAVRPTRVTDPVTANIPKRAEAVKKTSTPVSAVLPKTNGQTIARVNPSQTDRPTSAVAAKTPDRVTQTKVTQAKANLAKATQAKATQVNTTQAKATQAKATQARVAPAKTRVEKSPIQPSTPAVAATQTSRVKQVKTAQSADRPEKLPTASQVPSIPVQQSASTKLAALQPVEPPPQNNASQASVGSGPRLVPLESLQAFEAGECMLILPRTAGLIRTAFAAFGVTSDAAEEFQREMERRHAVDLSISLSPLDKSQCAATDFVRSLPSYPLFSMRIDIEQDVIKSGESVKGVLHDATGQLTLLLVDDEGQAHNVNGFLSVVDKAVVLNAPLIVTGNGVGKTQMFVAIAAPQALRTLADRRSRSASALFQQLNAELVISNIDIDVAVAAFRVE